MSGANWKHLMSWAPLMAKAFLEVWDSVVQMAVPVHEDENGSSPQDRFSRAATVERG